MSDTLRGSLNPLRTWWDVQHYHIEVEPDYVAKTLTGRVAITFAGHSRTVMQLDLQWPMQVDSIVFRGEKLSFSRDQHVVLVSFPLSFLSATDPQHVVDVFFSGKPREALRPPWDGGWIWASDDLGRPWMTVACQGLGASVWYPCKDHQSDKPDRGASLSIVVPDSLVGVGNGRLRSVNDLPGGRKRFFWEVTSAVNTYNVVPYIGAYTSFTDVFAGESGALDCSYWVLDYNLDKAKAHFKEVHPMLECFEHWMGPYPFYSDGYKLVESPHLGMEHQSAIAYGNRFQYGYLGRDLSGSGWGLRWDFIIVHESGHEWFGNNITTYDIADMWVHEGFTNYTETLLTECRFGTDAGQAYAQGIRQNIVNDIPVQGPYGVNKRGSNDMYYKGSALIHTIRTMMDDDNRFRSMLREMNARYRHGIVTSAGVERFMCNYSGLGDRLQVIFDQYLRTTEVPVVQWIINDDKIHVRLAEALPELSMRIWIPTSIGQGSWHWLERGKWLSMPSDLRAGQVDNLWNKNLYVRYLHIAEGG